MSEFLITADEHYGHSRIIEYCNRPFANTDEMREAMIERHNKRVPDSFGHLTIHLGDMFWESVSCEDAERILGRLHGRHALLYGNHDKVIEQNPRLQAKFEWVKDVHKLHFNKNLIWLSHYAHRVWPKSHKGSWHLYGHSHQGLPTLGCSFDAGVEGHDYTPWSLEEIAARMSRLKEAG